MKVALAGNQNSGKTSLFNLLTGANQKIGNWAGVTIERKSGYIKDIDCELIDLPGIYSLSPYTIEESISRQYILEEKPDAIINIIDATSIERSLYLTSQLMELGIRVIIALNMNDLLSKKGIEIDADKLSKELGLTVVNISALKNTGIKELKEALTQENGDTYNNYIFEADIERSIHILQNKLSVSRFAAVKILENDNMYQNYRTDDVKTAKEVLENKYKMDIDEIIANGRYEYIVHIKDKIMKKISVKESTSDKLDKIFLNKYLAFPIFIAIMFLVYYLSVGVVGRFTVDFIAKSMQGLSQFIESGLLAIGASTWSTSLVVDGIVEGVGAVLGFVPQLIILFICISLLETSGYTSRIAFLLDRIFKKLGLSGESLIPFIVGLGCSVPAIMATRVIKNKEQRELSIKLTPFIPCSAKLPIIALFAGYFFKNNSGVVSASLYFFSICVILICALLAKKLFMKESTSTFITELPDYKAPGIKYVAGDVTEKVMEFIKRAGTVILFCSVIVWFLVSFSWNLEYGVTTENSILASIGNKLAFIFYPILRYF